MSIEKENVFQRFKESVRFGDKFLPHFHVPKLIFASSYQTSSTFNSSTAAPTAASASSSASLTSSTTSTSTEAEFINLVDFKLINQSEYKAQYANEMVHSVSNEYFTFTKLTSPKENEYQFSTNFFEMKSINDIVNSDTQEKKLSYIKNLEFLEKSKPNKYFNTVFHSQNNTIVGILEQNTTKNSALFKAYMLTKNSSYQIGNNAHTDNNTNVELKAHQTFQYNFPYEIYFCKWSNTYVTNFFLAVGKFNFYVIDQENDSTKVKKLVEEIINADFSYNDEWISVSTVYDESKRFIHMYDRELNHMYKIAEYKNEKTVVLSTKKYKDIDPSEKEKVWLFTCGEVSKNEKKLEYSIYKLKNGKIVKRNEGSLEIMKTGPIFAFYVYKHMTIYLGMKGSKQILRLNFNKERKTIQIAQIFDYEHEIFSICAAPIRTLNVQANEIIRFYIIDTKGHLTEHSYYEIKKGINLETLFPGGKFTNLEPIGWTNLFSITKTMESILEEELKEKLKLNQTNQDAALILRYNRPTSVLEGKHNEDNNDESHLKQAGKFVAKTARSIGKSAALNFIGNKLAETVLN